MTSNIDRIDAWQTKVQAWMIAPFPFPWLIIGGLLLAAALMVAGFRELGTRQWAFLSLQATLIAALANATVFAERVLDEVADSFPALLGKNETSTKEWLYYWYDNIFWSKKNLVAGMCAMPVVFVCSWLIAPNVFMTSGAEVAAHFLNLIIGFLGGSLVWVMIGIARLMLSLGSKVEIKPSIFDTTTSPLRAASGVLWKISLVASLVYALGLSMCFVCSLTLPPINLLVLVLSGLFLLFYFVIPQMNIHRTLMRIKGERLGDLIVHIDRAFDEVTRDPTPANIGRLRDLFDLQHVVNGKRVWSFGLQELLMLVSSILIPLVLFVAGYYLKQR